MTDMALRGRNAAGVVTFNSLTALVLFQIDDRDIAGSSLTAGTAGLTFTYPAYTGFKISAFMQSPYNNGEEQGMGVQSCRVTYPSGVPTVQVFVPYNAIDHINPPAGYPVADGHLAVFYTGASQ